MITLKQYKNPNELVEYLISKGVSISNKEDALNKIKKYSYYSIINSYKDIFKTSDKHYKKMYLLMKYMLYMNLIKILDLYF